MAQRSRESIDFAACADLGERVGTDTLRFVRSFPVPIERVWAAVTTPDGIAAWLGRPLAIDAWPGGAFDIAFSDEDRMNGRVLEYIPNRRLAIAWHETSNEASAPYATTDDDTSLVTFDLTPDDAGGTVLVFTHQHILGGETMIGFGAGWHGHLAALGAWLDGALRVDREAFYATVKPAYEARFAAG